MLFRIAQLLSTTQRVSVVVPTWRRAAWLNVCVRAVLQQCPGELLVVGRAVDSEAQNVVHQAGRRTSRTVVRWLEVDRPGHVAPVQVGLSVATGEYVAFLDDDAVPEPGWLESLISP